MNWVSLVLLTMVCAVNCPAQAVAIGALKGQVGTLRRNVLAAAAKVPDSMYEYKPVAGVMSFHQQLAHIADVNYSLCAPLKGEANPNEGATEKTAPGKGVVAALTASFDYCEAGLSTMTDAKLAEMVKRGTSERPLAYYAFHFLDHVALHYGNLITYMRLNGIVPPESEGR